MTTYDQQFELPTEGQADWDTSLNANLSIAERGYHTVARVGEAVNTTDVLWMSSGGFFYKFNPNSLTIMPMALSRVQASSGESIQAQVFGAVRSLGTFVPGREYFVAPASP